MPITAAQLEAIYPFAKNRIPHFIDPLNAAMLRFGILEPACVAMFIAQVGHESGQLRYTEEIASGHAYEGRLDLGNVRPGDGPRFKGRGLIQITGRANYNKVSVDLFGDLRLLDSPEILAETIPACDSAGWFWNRLHLNQLCNDIRGCTRKINGGYNGLDDRNRLWIAAKQYLGVPG